MSNKILEELFYGNIVPYDQIRQTKEEKQKNQALCKAMDELEAKLPKPLQEELDNLLDKQSEVYDLEITQAFVQGFRLGARLSVEVFGKNTGAG